jgi:hypothetical protein
MKQIKSKSAKMFISAMLMAGAAVVARGVMSWGSGHSMWVLYLAVMAVIASRLRVTLPGVTGSMSMNLPFILVAVSRLSFSEAVLIAGLSTVAQSFPRQGGRFNWVQTSFNTSNIMLAAGVGFWASHAGVLTGVAGWDNPLVPAVACLTYFVAQTFPVAGVISLTENKSAVQVWREIAVLSFPYFVLSAGVAGTAVTVLHHLSWSVPVVALTVMYFVYRSYSRYFRSMVVAPQPERAMAAAGSR